MHMESFISDDDLLDLLEELDDLDAEVAQMDQEMEASSRRYEEIIKKHKND